MSKSDKHIAYYNKLHSEECTRASNLICETAPELNPETKEALTGVIADLATRVRVMEEYLVTKSDSEETFEPIQSSSGVMPVNNEIKVGIAEFDSGKKLGELNWNADGIPYREIPSASKITTEIQINRSSPKTLAIDIISCSDAALLKQCSIIVDGVELKHKVINFEGRKRLLAHIPKRKDGGHTHLLLKAPALETDQYIHLSDIFCVPKLSISEGVARVLGLG